MKKKNQEKQSKKAKKFTEKVTQDITFNLKIIGGILVAIFLALNIISSQLINSLFAPIVFQDKKAITQFFDVATHLRAFEVLHPELLESYQLYENSSQANAQDRQTRIQNLETLLQQNSKSRDVLYGLSVLYEAEGDTNKAQEYLRRAQEVDPMAGK